MVFEFVQLGDAFSCQLLVSVVDETCKRGIPSVLAMMHWNKQKTGLT